MKKKIKILLNILLIFVVSIFKADTFVMAEETMVYEPFIVVSSYKVSNDIIVPGKAFSLTVEVENTDDKVATRGSLMSISFPEGIRTAYQSSNQIYLEKLAPQEKREVTFELYANSSFSRSTAPFVITITSEVRSNSSTIYAPVQVDLSAFKVVSQSVPEEAGAGEKIAVSFSFKSLLTEKISNVTLSAYVDNESTPVTTVNIGNISGGAAKTQNLTFFIYEKGRHSVKFELSYNMAEGESSTVELYSGKIMITDPVEDAFPVSSDLPEEAITGQDKMIIVGCLGLSVILCIGIVLIAKKYN